MANPTTNYGWVLPTPTDLVTDLPADFDVALQGVDTTTKALNPSTTLGDIEYRSATANTNTRLPIGTSGQVLSVSGGVPAWSTPTAGMTNPMTTTGDTIYSSSGSTPARLGIGSTGNVLTVAGGVPTWAAPAAAGANWSLLNTGGTALAGSNTVTVSGISGKDKIMIMFDSAEQASASQILQIRINGDTGSNYSFFGGGATNRPTYSSSVIEPFSAIGNDNINLCVYPRLSTDGIASGYCLISGANASGSKIFNFSATSNNGGADTQTFYTGGGYWSNSATVTSVSLKLDSAGNFGSGRVYVYTSA